MTSLRDYLRIVEGGPPPGVPDRLRHGTSLMAMAGILRRDALAVSSRDDIGPPGVSLTANPQVAAEFANMRQDEGAEEEWPRWVRTVPPEPTARRHGAVLELDGAALARDGFEPQPHAGTADSEWNFPEEGEWRVQRPICPASRYILGIAASAGEINWMADLLRQAIPGTALDRKAPGAIDALRKLLADPRRQEPTG